MVTVSRFGVETWISTLPGMTGAGSLHAARLTSAPPTTSFVSSPAFCTLTVMKPRCVASASRSAVAASRALSYRLSTVECSFASIAVRPNSTYASTSRPISR